MPIQQMMLGGGGAGATKTYIDDIFSMDVWRGTNATKTITNGIDLSGEGGMTWIKTRDVGHSGRYHALADTVRGTNKLIRANDNDEQKTVSSSVQGFNSDGFELGGAQEVNWNTVGGSGDKYIGYTFRKAPGFFTIKQYTGSGSTQTLTHDLGSIPGAIFVKKLSGSPKNWGVYHRGQNNGSDPEDYRLRLDTIAAESDQTYWGDTAPTATHFTVGDAHDEVNVSGETYIAYLFAHEEATFGESSNKSVISCGYYSGNQVVGREIALGYEPQWLLIKRADSSESWFLWDTMRGLVSDGSEPKFIVNASTQEQNNNWVSVSPNGFKLDTSVAEVNSWAKYVYIAIRRPDGYVGKPAELGTDVFAMDTGAGSSTIPNFDSGFPVDFAFMRNPTSTMGWYTYSRLTQKKELTLNSTDSEGGASDYTFDSNVGWGKGGDSSSIQSWMFKRHAGFDVVTYTGNSTSDYSGASQVISHNLGKTPEMIWAKKRNGSGYWGVYHKDLNGGTNPANYRLLLNDTHAESAASGSYTNWYWNNTAPTATQFSVGEVPNVNDNNLNHIAMLFASVDGISKVGSYTGSSSTVTVTTGFQPRFVIIRRVEATDEWVLLDTLRGWGSGNDAFLHPNTSGAQNSNMDLGAPTSTGFTVTTTYNTLNTNGENFIYYAHA